MKLEWFKLLMIWWKWISNYFIKEDEFMPKITDYGFFFQQIFGTKNNVGVINPLKVSDLSNSSLRSQLNTVGIETNSA